MFKKIILFSTLIPAFCFANTAETTTFYEMVEGQVSHYCPEVAKVTTTKSQNGDLLRMTYFDATEGNVDISIESFDLETGQYTDKNVKGPSYKVEDEASCLDSKCQDISYKKISWAWFGLSKHTQTLDIDLDVDAMKVRFLDQSKYLWKQAKTKYDFSCTYEAKK